MPPHPKMLYHADAPVPKHRMSTLGQSTYSQTGPGIEHLGSNHTYPPLPDSNASSSPFSQTGPGLPGQFPDKAICGDPSHSHAHSEPPYPLKHSSSPAPCENSSKALASPALPPEDHPGSLTIRVPGSAKRERHELSEEAEDTGSEVLVQKILTDPHGYESKPGLDKRNRGGKGRQKEKRQGTRVVTRVVSQDDACSKSTIVQLQTQLEGVTAEAGIATAKAEASGEKARLVNVMAAQAMARMEQSKEGELQERIAREAHEKCLQELEDIAAWTREEAEQSKEEACQEQVAREAREKRLLELESALTAATANQDRSGMGVGVAPVDPALSPPYLSGSGAGESGPMAGRGREDVDMTSGEAQERNLSAESSTVELQPGAIQPDEDFKMAGDKQEDNADNEGDGSSKPRTLGLRINHSMKMKGKGVLTQTLDMHAIAAQLDDMKAMWAMNTQLIMELQQEYAGRRPSHRGPVVFKQPPVRNHNQDRMLMLGIVRREMNELMGIVRDLQVINIEHATHEEVESFDFSMRVYWSNLKVGWNNELEEKFIQAFRVKYPDIINSAAKETVVHDMYFDRLTRLKKALILFGQREGEQEEEHEARILQQLNAKLYRQHPNTRRATTYEDRLEICKANSKLDDGLPDVAWLSIQGIVTALKAGGMSSDESDTDGDGNKVFHVKRLEWRSSEIDGIMDSR
ncbi:hypothetical protein EV421DRAFT_1913074 [Armillaria borealis]|uniref:Uncharacterized protein n=1 Tax=Armillaria borealis TaxID=47425 RepID=A0AA39ITN9_9AGAR|nr:hypothetical protein EV421DRAFT_1913074 [Armillaria borealis]